MNREAWWTVVHRVTQSQTRPAQLSMHISVDSTSHRSGSMWFVYWKISANKETSTVQIHAVQESTVIYKWIFIHWGTRSIFFFSLIGTNHLKHVETSQLVVVASLEGQLQWGGEKWKLYCNGYWEVRIISKLFFKDRVGEMIHSK